VVDFPESTCPMTTTLLWKKREPSVVCSEGE
jgi:hypothetical protein